MPTATRTIASIRRSSSGWKLKPVETASPTKTRDISREWDARRIFPEPTDRLPGSVARTFNQETIGCRDINYYEYVAGDQSFYAVHYTTPGGRRTEARVDANGKLLGKLDLNDTQVAHYRERERDLGSHWAAEARPAAAAERGRVPAAAAPTEQPVKISANDAPRAIRDAVRSQAKSEKDVEYYRNSTAGRSGDDYIVGFTDQAGRRLHLRMRSDGTIIERTELKDGVERPVR